MTLAELIEKEGIEQLQSKLQEAVSKKIDNDEVKIVLDPDGDDYMGFIAKFVQVDEGNNMRVNLRTVMELWEEIDEENYIDYILKCHAEQLQQDCYDMPEDFTDWHRTNYVEKVNNR